MEVDCSNVVGTSPVSELSVLLVSDSHYGLDQLDALSAIMENERIDLTLHSGDIIDLPMDDMHVAAEIEAERRQQVDTVISKLVACTKGAPVYYIPGNHDPISMFSEWSPLVGRTSMVHRSLHRIAPSLVVAGLGGSVPGYRDGKQVWNSVPYKTNEALQEDLEPMVEAICAERSSCDQTCLTPDDSVILMTHVGPDGFDTSLDRSCHGSPSHPVHGGSTYLGQAMGEATVRSHCFLNVHGHVHLGHGRSNTGDVSIINPGSLKEGRYGRMQLKRDDGAQWRVASIAFHTL